MLRIAGALVAALCFIPAAHADLIVNGGFETGDFTGWTQSGWFIEGTNPHSGVYDASTGCSGASCTTVGDLNSAYLYQNVATKRGTKYTLSLFYNSGQLPTAASELLLLWGNSAAPSLSTVVDLVNVDTSGSYVQYTGTVTATSASSQIEFLGRQDLDFYALDDISVNELEESSVPECPSILLVLSGLLLISTLRLRTEALR